MAAEHRATGEIVIAGQSTGDNPRSGPNEETPLYLRVSMRPAAGRPAGQREMLDED